MDIVVADRVSEAEVSLLFADFLLGLPGSANHASVAIDGAGVMVAGVAIFGIEAFLATRGWEQSAQVGKNKWTGEYRRGEQTLQVHSQSGIGDVVATVAGRRFVAECKKGPLVTKPGSPERPLLTLALGQALITEAGPNDIVLAVVPATAAFRALAERWRRRPMLLRSGIGICLVGRDGSVEGFDPAWLAHEPVAPATI